MNLSRKFLGIQNRLEVVSKIREMIEEQQFLNVSSVIRRTIIEQNLVVLTRMD